MTNRVRSDVYWALGYNAKGYATAAHLVIYVNECGWKTDDRMSYKFPGQQQLPYEHTNKLSLNMYVLKLSILNRDTVIDTIPSFRLRDNSVHDHECSPFWAGISTMCLQ